MGASRDEGAILLDGFFFNTRARKKGYKAAKERGGGIFVLLVGNPWTDHSVRVYVLCVCVRMQHVGMLKINWLLRG